MGVIALSGSTPLCHGIEHTRVHTSAVAEPARRVAGKSVWWFDDFVINLATCGTANPKNDMGPQYEVTIAVSKPVHKSNNTLALFMLTPKFAAYLSPNSNALSGFTSKIERIIPIKDTPTKSGISESDTLEKSPIPQIVYENTFFSDAKKFKRVIAEFVTYPTIIPTISNITLLRTTIENRIITPSVNIAPIKAPKTFVIEPETAPITPPVANITTATPNDAPDVIPKMDGPANGFEKAVCNNNPATAKLAPARRAVMA